jgi:hypothetical protein
MKKTSVSPNNTDVLNNLTFAQNSTVDEVKVIPKVGLKIASRLYNAFIITINGLG